MRTLPGQGFGAAPVMGRAARVSVIGGRATLDDTLLGALDTARRRDIPELGLVLVAEDAATALLLALPTGAVLHGVIAQRPLAAAPHLPEGIAVLAGVENATLAVGEGEQVIVDPHRGVALVEPHAEEVVRLQARPKPRLLIGAEHTPAFTLDGRYIAVWGRALTPEDATLALAEGADGLLVEGEWSEATLLVLAEQVGGGELTLAFSLDEIDPETVVTLAAGAVVRWCVAPETLPLPVETWRTELTELVTERADNGEPAALPQLLACDTPTPGFDATLVRSGVLPDPDPECLPWEQPPLYVEVSAPFGALLGLEEAVDAGAAGVVVPPDWVAAVKDQIRQLGEAAVI